MGLLTLILTNLPTIIKVAGDISTVVGAAKATGSVYAAVKQNYPKIADVIDEIGNALPAAAGTSPADHVEGIAQALFVHRAWSQDQLNAWMDRFNAIA